MRPKIGITLDCEEKGSFSKRPYYALRKIYFDIIYAAGGLPVAIPHIDHAIDDYLAEIKAIVIPGGNFASPESWYISESETQSYEPSPRLESDLAVIEKAFELDMPMLGICAGMQLMGGLKGCKMTHDVHKFVKTDIDHLNEKPAEQFAHKVKVTKNSLLEKITGCREFDVNTAHREAIVEVPDNIIVNAVAPDGVIEGIEFPDKKFAIGVQWHPEFFLDKNDPSFKLFEALVRAVNSE